MISKNPEVLKDLEALQSYIKAELNVVKVRGISASVYPFPYLVVSFLFLSFLGYADCGRVAGECSRDCRSAEAWQATSRRSEEGHNRAR